MDYETLAANLRRLVAEGADADEIQKAANAVASAESARKFQADQKLREEERQSGRQLHMREGDRLKDDQSLWPGRLRDHLEANRYFETWSEIADEACRIAGIEAGSPMRCLVDAVAFAAAQVGEYDY